MSASQTDPGVLSSSTGNDQTCFLDVTAGDTERSDQLKLNVVKDEDELRERILSLTPSQLHAFELMTDLYDQQRLLFLTGPKELPHSYCGGSADLLSGTVR